jgi:aspartate/methionine/tyrosine aminotransferase
MEAILTLVDQGDEVLLPVPAWPSFKEMITFAGGVPVEVNYMNGVEDFLSGLSRALTPRTKLLIFNYPNNPTGYSYSEKDVRRIADFALNHNLFVISDEIYERIVYGFKHFSIASIPDAAKNVLTVIGFSKSYAMTGWRLGYAAGPLEVIKAINKIQQQSVTCVPGFIQMAAVAALQRAGRDVEKMIDEFKQRRDFICKRLGENSVFFLEKIPEGAFYVFPRFSYKGMTSSLFEDFLYDELGISVTGGSAFGGFDDRLRISYAASMDLIGEATQRLDRLKST